MKRSILVFVFCALSFLCEAQDFHHNLFWFRLVLTDKINDKLRWELYLQNRTQSDQSENTHVFEANHMRNIWVWFHYRLTEHLKLGVAPVGLFQSSMYISRPEEALIKPVNEYRFALRLDQENKYTSFVYSTKIGVESRWRDLKYDGVYQHNFRFRYMARVDVPLFKRIDKPPLLTVSAYDEIMIQAGAAVKDYPNVFDQNRAYIGLGTPISQNTRVSVGYLFIVQQRLNGKDFDKANVLWVILTFDNLFGRFRNKNTN